MYAPGIGPLARLADTDAATWRRVFDTNVTGAALVTSAAIDDLTASGGTAVYLSSVSASLTPPWPGLGAYAVSKAALDKLVEAWRAEHPQVGFTRVVVGDCGGGEGDAQTQFANEWDMELAAELYPDLVGPQLPERLAHRRRAPRRRRRRRAARRRDALDPVDHGRAAPGTSHRPHDRSAAVGRARLVRGRGAGQLGDDARHRAALRPRRHRPARRLRPRRVRRAPRRVRPPGDRRRSAAAANPPAPTGTGSSR